MNRQEEFRPKIARLRQVLDETGLDGLLIGTPANFAWATAGGHAVVASIAPMAVAMLLVSREAVYVVCSNIEASRLRDEEVGELDLEIRAFDWFRGEVHKEAKKIVRGKLGADHAFKGFQDVGGRITPLRFSLTEGEVERYRALGRDVGEAIGEAARSLRPGLREHEAAGRLRELCSARGAESVVTLVAADDRIAKYRHPVPTDQAARETMMLVTCARRRGLIVAATRIVRFAPASRELRRKHEAVCFIDATYIAATQPGAPLASILQRGIEAYKERRFSREWKLHHQGGPTGYAPREFTVTPKETRAVAPNQPFAWNPSITGTKSEDTILALPDGPEIVSETPGWPMVEIEIDGHILRRPDLLLLG